MAEVSEDGGALSLTGEANNGRSTFPDWTPMVMQPTPLSSTRQQKKGGRQLKPNKEKISLR